MAVVFGIKKFHWYLFGRRFHCLRTPCCLVLNLVSSAGRVPPATLGYTVVGLYSCQPISMTLNTGLPRIMQTLTHCFDCLERPWKSQMIGASKLIKSTAVKCNDHQSQCLKSARPHEGILFSLARYTAFCIVG